MGSSQVSKRGRAWIHISPVTELELAVQAQGKLGKKLRTELTDSEKEVPWNWKGSKAAPCEGKSCYGPEGLVVLL